MVLIKTIAKLILVWNLLMIFSQLTFMEPGTTDFCYWPSLIVLTVGTGTGDPPQSPPGLSYALLCGTKGGITGGLNHLPLSGVIRILLYCSPSDWLSCTGWNRADNVMIKFIVYILLKEITHLIRHNNTLFNYPFKPFAKVRTISFSP